MNGPNGVNTRNITSMKMAAFDRKHTLIIVFGTSTVLSTHGIHGIDIITHVNKLPLKKCIYTNQIIMMLHYTKWLIM